MRLHRSLFDGYVRRADGSYEFVTQDERVVKLLDIPPRSQNKRLTLRVTLSETKQKDKTMRCVFETQLKVDIDTTDDKLRKAFIDLVLLKAREAYGVAGMLAKGTPVIQVAMISRDGREDIPLFEAAARDVDEDDDI